METKYDCNSSCPETALLASTVCNGSRIVQIVSLFLYRINVIFNSPSSISPLVIIHSGSISTNSVSNILTSNELSRSMPSMISSRIRNIEYKISLIVQYALPMNGHLPLAISQSSKNNNSSASSLFSDRGDEDDESHSWSWGSIKSFMSMLLSRLSRVGWYRV